MANILGCIVGLNAESPCKFLTMERDHKIGWILRRTKDLIGKWNQHGDGSFVLYAAFECRNMLEILDFQLLYTNGDDPEEDRLLETAKGKRGIPSANKEDKTLNYKHQAFWAAYAYVIGFPTVEYDYKGSRKLQESLGEYMHTYTRMSHDFAPGSSFMENGAALIGETINFVQTFCMRRDHNGQDAIMYGGFKISTLPDKMRELYDNWRRSSNTGEEAETQLRADLADLMKDEPPVDWAEVFGQ